MHRPLTVISRLTVLLVFGLLVIVPARAADSRYRHLDINLTSEADYDHRGELPSSDGIGIDLAFSWTDPGGIIGRADADFPLAVGYTVGIYGGYCEPLAPGPDKYVFGWTLAIGDLLALSVTQVGARVGVTLGNANDWQDEWLRVDLTADLGGALIETEEREAFDLISITHKAYVVIAPGVTVHTPLRWRSNSSWPSLDLMAGANLPLYLGRRDFLTSVRLSVGLGVVFGR